MIIQAFPFAQYDVVDPAHGRCLEARLKTASLCHRAILMSRQTIEDINLGDRLKRYRTVSSRKMVPLYLLTTDIGPMIFTLLKKCKRTFMCQIVCSKWITLKGAGFFGC